MSDLLVDVEPQLDTAALGAHVKVAEEAVEAVAAVVPDVGATRVAEGQRMNSLLFKFEVECRENRHFTMFQSKIQYKPDIKQTRLNICNVKAQLQGRARLRELAPCGQRESGGGIHVT